MLQRSFWLTNTDGTEDQFTLTKTQTDVVFIYLPAALDQANLLIAIGRHDLELDYLASWARALGLGAEVG